MGSRTNSQNKKICSKRTSQDQSRSLFSMHVVPLPTFICHNLYVTNPLPLVILTAFSNLFLSLSLLSSTAFCDPHCFLQPFSVIVAAFSNLFLSLSLLSPTFFCHCRCFLQPLSVILTAFSNLFLSLSLLSPTFFCHCRYFLQPFSVIVAAFFNRFL